MQKDLLLNIHKDKIGIDNDDFYIGNVVAEKYEADLKLERWNGENSLAIAYENFNVDTPKEIDGEIILEKEDESFYFKKHSDKEIKFGLILKKKPIKNSWQFKLTWWEDFNFFYQPFLTEADKAIGRKASRDDLEGSYSIRHKTKRDHVEGETNYRIGKFGHFYRPKFIDSDGEWVWANLNITEGIYTVTCPQSFLDTAKYPVKANDTFGNEDVGGFSRPCDNVLYGSGYACGGSGTTSKMTAYVVDTGITGNHLSKCAIYLTNGNKVAESDEENDVSSTPGWHDYTIETSVSAQTYALCIAANNGAVSAIDLYIYEEATAVTLYSKAITYPTFPSPAGFSTGTAELSIYATFGSEASSSSSSVSSSSSSSSLSSSSSSVSSSSSSISSSSSSSVSSSSSSSLSSSSSSLSSSSSASSSSSSSVSSSSSSIHTIEYTRGDEVTLPADDTNLETALNTADEATISTDNGTYVQQEATDEYSIFLFKDRNTGENSNFRVTWNGKSSRDASVSTIYLQIYNRTSGEWETLDSNNTTEAGTDFDLIGIKILDLGNYYDENGWVSCRVYQEAK